MPSAAGGQVWRGCSRHCSAALLNAAEPQLMNSQSRFVERAKRPPASTPRGRLAWEGTPESGSEGADPLYVHQRVRGLRRCESSAS